MEYADILCSQCARAHNEITPQIQKEYIETKKAHMEVRLVGVIAPDSQRAAEGAYCAAEQGMFWEYLDNAFRETQEKFYSKNLKADSVDLFTQAKIAQFAGRVGLEVAPWQSCMDNNEYAKVLMKNKETMATMKAYGTPFYIMNGESYRGAPPYAFFQKALDAEYKKATQGE